jgi:hypothetical protein
MTKLLFLPTLKTFKLFFIPNEVICNLSQPHELIVQLSIFFFFVLKNSFVLFFFKKRKKNKE